MEDRTQNSTTDSFSGVMDESKLAGMSQDQLIDLFIEELMLEKGIKASDVEKNNLSDKLKDAVMTEILMSLPDYLVNRINEGFENGSATDELFDQAVKESGIDANKIAEKVMIKFRDDYLNDKLKEEK